MGSLDRVTWVETRFTSIFISKSEKICNSLYSVVNSDTKAFKSETNNVKET